MKYIKKFNENNWFMNPGNPMSPISPLNPTHPLNPEMKKGAKILFGEEETKDNTDENKWAIYAGLSGGFGGATFKEFHNGSRKDAEDYAYQLAVQEYESYEWLHGLRTVQDIMDEDGIDDEGDAEQIYNEEREGWLDYWVEPFNPSKNYK